MQSPKPITDNHGRPINYLRLAVTDRCNLRCFYCMPEQGIDFVPRKELLTYEEMLRLISILAQMGVNKVRITGGEPLIRKDVVLFLENLSQIQGVDQIHITTNGVVAWKYLDRLRQIGIRSINLSLDTLSPQKFFQITRRDEFHNVMKTFNHALELGFPVKINCVVMANQNTDDIIPILELSKDHPVSVRFIEEMPFNGTGSEIIPEVWTHQQILDEVRRYYPKIRKLNDPYSSTSSNYHIPGFKGDFGIIAAYTRTFCGECGRIRLTAQGQLRTCLYDTGSLDLKSLLRAGASDQALMNGFKSAFMNRFKDGFEAEESRSVDNPLSESMSTIGG